MHARKLWLALVTTASLGILGCGNAGAPVVQTAADGVAPGSSYAVQQGESGTAICGRRYRLCLRTLVRELGSQAIEVCQERRDRCINALGEGYFSRRN
jgi:hypothetical protein